MKKGTIFILILITSLLVSGVLGEAITQNRDTLKNSLSKKFFKGENITSIKQVNLTSLPKEIKINKIGKNNISIYKAEVENKKPFFIINVGKGIKEINKKETLSLSFLSFGAQDIKGSGFLKTSEGSETGLNSGYVMMNKGSITGISTSLEVAKSNPNSDIIITIYKNGKEVGISNILDPTINGPKKSFTIQSKDITTFKEGDIISVYVNSKDTEVKNVITLVKLENTN